ncbi:MAG: fibronectin type III domain-containing protein [Desulfobacterales bacterium]|nr:fibronectin type III domain-containing protein [Desulfobacterales bacterium]
MKKSYVTKCLRTRFSIFRFLLLLTFALVFFLFPQNVYSLDVPLAWDPNSEDNLAGYRIFYREDGQSYDYEQPAWEGSKTTCTIYNLNDKTTYYFVARAFDTLGSESGDSNEARYQFNKPHQGTPGTVEIGEVSVDHNWKRIKFNDTFIDPVVVANPLSYNGGDPAVLRIRNVESTGFDIRVQEWDYLNGTHTTENVSYIVMERGSYILEDGTKVEAGRFNTDATGSFEWVDFSQTFNQVPVVTSTVSSFNEEDAVCSRLRNIDTTGFDFCMQEQELNSQRHTIETISYIAWEPSSGTVGNLTFEVDKTDDVITHNLQTIVYNETFMATPVFLADMQTTDGGDTANLRRQNKDFYGIDIKITEEQSRDSEINHTTEVVGYMVFAKCIDTDGDGLTDDDEINIYGTDPNNPDTDGDGINDGDEVEFWGYNWNVDVDNDGIINLLDSDADGDGFLDGTEKDEGFDPGDPNSNPAFPLEIGEVSVDHNWKRVEFNDTFIDPVVVANPLSYNGGDPAVLRIRNVESTGFDIRVQEWDYLNGTHTTENVSYIVMERGSYILEDGTKVEAGRFNTDATGSFEWVDFSQTFNQVPVVTSTVSSFNEEDAVCSRLRNIDTTGFDFCMQEQELNSQRHTIETISYIAWEPSSGTVGNLTFEVDKTDDVITHNLQTIVYNETFMATPVFLADMQTTDGGDTANLRRQNKNSDGIDINITEEQSRDSEINHTTEVVGYMVFAFIE